MKKLIKNIDMNILDKWKYKLLSLIYYIMVFTYLEVTLHLVIYNTVDTRIIYLLLFGCVSGSIVFLACSLLPKSINRILGIVAIFLVVLYFEVQLVYHCIFGSFMPVTNLFMGTQAVTNFASQLMHAIKTNIVYIILLFLPVPVSIVVFCTKFIKTERLKLIQIPICGIITALLSCATLITLHHFNTSPTSAYAILVNSNSSTETSVQTLGLAATTLQETRSFINSQNAPLTFSETSVDNRYTDIERNEQQIDFAELIQSTDDTNLILMDNYVSGLSGTSKNDYTGIAKDYNIVTICAEAFSPLAISEELTPTLYKLSTSGLVFKNFYNSFPNTTTNGEYTFCMGLMPNMTRNKIKSSFNDSASNHLPYTLGNALNSLGYETYAYHNYYATFYDRHITHPNMGYDFKAISMGLDINVSNPCSDHDMMLESISDFINSESPFHAYYMTYSGHYQYNWNNAMSLKNKDKVAHLPYSEEVKAFIACNLEVEYALQALVEALEEAGKAENTMIVLTADHYPYGLSDEQYSELAGYPVDTAFEKYRNSFICYIPGIETVEVNDYCSSEDILPTVLNLLGVEYDSRLIAGKDVMSDAPHVAILADRSFITNEFKYNANTGEAVTHDGQPVDAAKINDYCNYVSNVFTLSAGILQNDYYGHVFGVETSEEAVNVHNFDDITSPYTEAAVTFMINHEYMLPEAEDTFGAKTKAYYSEFLNVLYQMAGSPETLSSAEYEPALAWAISEGYVTDPAIWDRKVTYGGAAQIMYKYVDKTSGIENTDQDDEVLPLIIEYPELTREEITAIKWCVSVNVISAPKSGTRYEQCNNTVNRGQIATFLQRMYFVSINE